MMFDEKIDFCEWIANRWVHKLIPFFEAIGTKNYNPELLKCPIRKGFYIAAEARKQIQKLNDSIPFLIPLRGNLTVKVWWSTRLDERIVKLGNQTEVFKIFH